MPIVPLFSKCHHSSIKTAHLNQYQKIKKVTQQQDQQPYLTEQQHKVCQEEDRPSFESEKFSPMERKHSSQKATNQEDHQTDHTIKKDASLKNTYYRAE